MGRRAHGKHTAALMVVVAGLVSLPVACGEILGIRLGSVANGGAGGAGGTGGNGGTASGGLGGAAGGGGQGPCPCTGDVEEVTVLGGQGPQVAVAAAVLGGDVVIVGTFLDRIAFHEGLGTVDGCSYEGFAAGLEGTTETQWAYLLSANNSRPTVADVAATSAGYVVVGDSSAQMTVGEIEEAGGGGAGGGGAPSCPVPGELSASVAGSGDEVFAVGVSASGAAEWLTLANTGFGSQAFHAVAVTANDDIYAVGKYSGPTTIDPSPILPMTGGDELLVMRLAADGTPAWAVGWHGLGDDNAVGVDVLPGGAAVVLGTFNDSIILGNRDPYGSLGATDVLVARIESDRTVAWATQIGTPSIDEPVGIVVGPDDAVHVALLFPEDLSIQGNDLPSLGALTLGWVTFSSSGDVLGARSIAATADPADKFSVNSITLDPFGHLVVGGSFSGALIGSGVDQDSAELAGFVMKVRPNGDVIYVKQLRGTMAGEQSSVMDVAIMPDGGTVAVGAFTLGFSLDGTPYTSPFSSEEMFVLKLSL